MKPSTSEGNNLYFAYGANMSSRYLRNVRNINAIDSKRAVLAGYQLVFSLKGPNFIEPGFASIRESETAKVEGVLHSVTDTDLNSIIASEPSSYEIIDILISSGGSVVEAKTLVNTIQTHVEYKPSKRYLNLLISAGNEYGFSSDYMHELKKTDSVYYPIISEVFGSVVHAYVLFNSRKATN